MRRKLRASHFYPSCWGRHPLNRDCNKGTCTLCLTTSNSAELSDCYQPWFLKGLPFWNDLPPPHHSPYSPIFDHHSVLCCPTALALLCLFNYLKIVITGLKFLFFTIKEEIEISVKFSITGMVQLRCAYLAQRRMILS